MSWQELNWTKEAIDTLINLRDNGVPEGVDLPPVIKSIVDAGGLPASFKVHSEASEVLVADELGLKYIEAA